jgi:hypothetical protein
MNSQTPADQTSRSTGAYGSKAAEGAPLAPDLAPSDGMTETVSQLSRDVARLKDTFAQLLSQASDAGTKTVRDFGQTVASHVSSAASGGRIPDPTSSARPRDMPRRLRLSSKTRHGAIRWARLEGRCWSAW